jgi:hypothetical protein
MDGYIKAIRRGAAVVVSPETRFGVDSAKRACAFHRSFPEYEPTPLVELKNLAAALGVKSVRVKDESFRFGLNAFKSLGGSYCVGRYIAKKLGCDISEMPYDRLVSDEVKSRAGDITFVTATDGNHGRGIAWTANRLRQKSVVYMPKGSSQERLDNIRALGADACITDLSYDDAVRLAKTRAEQNGWVLVQDTSWPGYEEIPTWIMQGYTTMGLEIAKPAARRDSDAHLPAGRSRRHVRSHDRLLRRLLRQRAADRHHRGAQQGRLPLQDGRSRTTALCTRPTAAWTPSWRGWPAASPAGWAGTCC